MGGNEFIFFYYNVQNSRLCVQYNISNRYFIIKFAIEFKFNINKNNV